MYSKIENLLAQNQQPAASAYTGQITEKGLKWGKDPMLRSLPNWDEQVRSFCNKKIMLYV